jgi:hypothetical protein
MYTPLYPIVKTPTQGGADSGAARNGTEENRLTFASSDALGLASISA